MKGQGKISRQVKSTPSGRDAPLPTERVAAVGFGGPTGDTVAMAEGELLPPAPIGFNWRLIEDGLEVLR